MTPKNCRLGLFEQRILLNNAITIQSHLTREFHERSEVLYGYVHTDNTVYRFLKQTRNFCHKILSTDVPCMPRAMLTYLFSHPKLRRSKYLSTIYQKTNQNFKILSAYGYIFRHIRQTIHIPCT